MKPIHVGRVESSPAKRTLGLLPCCRLSCMRWAAIPAAAAQRGVGHSLLRAGRTRGVLPSAMSAISPGTIAMPLNGFELGRHLPRGTLAADVPEI